MNFLRRPRQRTGQYLGQRVGAGIALLRDSELLLIQRRDNGLWDIPGGAVNPGENVYLAALREAVGEWLRLPASLNNAGWPIAFTIHPLLAFAPLRFGCAAPQLTEETGIQVGSATLLDVFSGPAFQHTYPDGNTVDWVTVLYRSRSFTGAAKAADDAVQAAWWPLHALPQEVSPATRAYFRAIQAAETGGPS